VPAIVVAYNLFMNAAIELTNDGNQWHVSGMKSVPLWPFLHWYWILHAAMGCHWMHSLIAVQVLS
jgi:hypothetical protein